MFAVLPEACVGCLACVRVCPVGAIAVEGPQVQIEDDTFAPQVDRLTMDSPAPLQLVDGKYPVPQPGILTTREY